MLVLALVMLLLQSGTTWAAGDADLKVVVATLEDGYRLLRDLQADFSQKTTLTISSFIILLSPN